MHSVVNRPQNPFCSVMYVLQCTQNCSNEFEEIFFSLEIEKIDFLNVIPSMACKALQETTSHSTNENFNQINFEFHAKRI